MQCGIQNPRKYLSAQNSRPGSIKSEKALITEPFNKYASLSRDNQ